MKDKLIIVDGLTQTGFSLDSRNDPLAHCLVEVLGAPFSVCFGLIHRRVSISEEVFGSIASGTEGDSDTGRDKHPSPLQKEWLGKSFKDSRRDCGGVDIALNMGEKNGELVS